MWEDQTESRVYFYLFKVRGFWITDLFFFLLCDYTTLSTPLLLEYKPPSTRSRVLAARECLKLLVSY